ncbi:MAG: SusC/RagA family TonB-linked outer membrane protein [Sphingobacteriales bacterium]|nr:MAG: SusC/RagA family TonB-linked outer membrane protein [Sphingobacteriales bacterium]
MFKKITLLGVLAMLCLFLRGQGQAVYTLSGRVVDAQQQAVANVTIKIAHQNLGIADKEGQFTVRTHLPKGVLSFSAMGYQTQTLTFEGNKAKLLVVLQEETAALQEVEINAGYYTVKEKLLTGNIATVKANDIERQPVSNPLAALQGRVAGMVISQTSGVAGSLFKVQLRGQSALDLSLSQNDPLFVIDGVPFEAGLAATNQHNSAANNPTSISSGGLSPLNTINPADIEQISILKDADATAIYGSRGANGVVLIITKRGKRGELVVNLDAATGWSRVGRTMPMMNTQQYVAMRREAFKNDKLSMTTLNAPDIMLWDTTRYTDFKKLLIGNTAQQQRVQLSLSGGNEQTRFLMSGNYNRATSVYSSNFANQVNGFRLSLNHNSKDQRLQLQVVMGLGQDQNSLPRYDLTRYINTIPNLNLYTNDGKLRWEDENVQYRTISDLINPLSLLEESHHSANTNLNASFNLGYQLIEGLKLTLSSGYNLFSTAERFKKPSSSIDSYATVLPSAGLANSKSGSWLVEPQLSFEKSLQKHRFTAMLGSTLQHRQKQSNRTTGTNYGSDLLLDAIAAAGTITAANDELRYRYGAMFGRVNYVYDQKYVLNFSGRRDGSSRFGPAKRWANFGAVGAAWIISGMPWLKEQFPRLSFAKLRASYGTTGNDQIGDYMYLNLWGNSSVYNGLASLYPISLYNADYSWEINKKAELGLDLGFFKDRLQVAAAYYNNRSNNQLINYVLPSQTGFFQVIKNFPGLVENKGLELVLSGNVSAKAFKWSGSFNISFPKNKLLAFPELENSSYRTTYNIGQPLGMVRGLNYQGVDANTGLYTFSDTNGDGLLSTADYQVLGHTNPKYFGGFQQHFSYKGFSLNVFFHFVKHRGLNYFKCLHLS